MEIKGPWTRSQIDDFLEETRAPIRLAVNGRSGHPVVAPLWFLPLEGRLWCATQQTAGLVSILNRDPRCAFEVSVETPPYCGVRGPALATLHEDRAEEILGALVDRHVGRRDTPFSRYLLERVDREVAIEIAPREVTSWDYRERMGERE
jgi:nitroimidazol reductase NimA-like FMN-containing flavoprotein (pyridoxamine 5'-phosphate oxidase superfamily)